MHQTRQPAHALAGSPRAVPLPQAWHPTGPTSKTRWARHIKSSDAMPLGPTAPRRRPSWVHTADSAVGDRREGARTNIAALPCAQHPQSLPTYAGGTPPAFTQRHATPVTAPSGATSPKPDARKLARQGAVDKIHLMLGYGLVVAGSASQEEQYAEALAESPALLPAMLALGVALGLVFLN